jgi:hypothetical protein
MVTLAGPAEAQPGDPPGAVATQPGDLQGAAASFSSNTTVSSKELRSHDNPDGIPTDGHPLFSSKDDLLLLRDMLQEWTDAYPIDAINLTMWLPLITPDQLNKCYHLYLDQVTNSNVAFIRQMKKRAKQKHDIPFVRVQRSIMKAVRK